ncbi:hypothetical protein EJP02_062 [Escherichia phage EJP2]|nr:hypothetical protein EJP02_062 [Escherichia phage EJP2]
MSFWKSNEQRLEVVNTFIDILPVLHKFVARGCGENSVYKSNVDEIFLQINAYQSHVMYCTSEKVLNLITFDHDQEYKSNGAFFDSASFISDHYLNAMNIHQRRDYVDGLRESIDAMNNTFSTGYLSEEEHFQYSTLFEMPAYEDLSSIHETMNRCIGDFCFQIRFTKFEDVLMPPEQFMAKLKEGTEKLC